MTHQQVPLDLVVEHEHISSWGSLTLAWASATMVEQPIPKSCLWAPFATAGPGPVLLYVEQGSVPCSSKLYVYGTGLSLATCGFEATFGIMAQDQFGNNLASFSPEVWANLVPLPEAAAGPGGFDSNRTQATHPQLLEAQDVGSQRRFNRYGATVYSAGSYLLNTATLLSVGLAATYYYPPPRSFSSLASDEQGAALRGAGDTALGRPFEVRQDSVVDFSANASAGWGNAQGLGMHVSGGFNVRWGGVMVSKPHSLWGTAAYNFSVRLTQNEQRIRLWADNVLLIDQWSSLDSLLTSSFQPLTVQSSKSGGLSPDTSAASGFSAAFSHGNRTSFSLRLEYAGHTSVKHGITLFSASSFTPADSLAAGTATEQAVLGSDVLYQAVHAHGSPFTLTVRHGPISGPKSEFFYVKVTGDAVSIMTAGVVGSFRILMRDEWGNRIKSVDQTVEQTEIFTVFASYTTMPTVLSGRCLNGSTTTTLLLSHSFAMPMPYNLLANHSITIGRQSRRVAWAVSSVSSHMTPGGETQAHIRAGLATPLESPPSPNEDFVIRILEQLPATWASITQAPNSEFRANLSVTRASSMALYAQVARAGGLAASYYASPHQMHATAMLTRQDNTIDFSAAAASAGWPGVGAMNASGGETSVAVKWRGFVAPRYAQTYTFRAIIHDYLGTSHNERVALWIDNQQVIAQWSSLASFAPTGTFSFVPSSTAGPSSIGSTLIGSGSRVSRPFLFEMHYKDSESGARRCKLEWESAEHGRLHASEALHNQRLFYPVDLDASPYQVMVRPGIAHAAMTSWWGQYNGLLPARVSGADAVYNTSFVLRDTFGNARQSACLSVPSSDASSSSALAGPTCEDALRLEIRSLTTGYTTLPQISLAYPFNNQEGGWAGGWQALNVSSVAGQAAAMAGYQAASWSVSPFRLYTSALLTLEVRAS